MLKHITRIALAVVFGLMLGSVGECQSLPPWISHEIYSNADGTVQFVVMEITGYGPSLVGRTLVASDNSTDHSFTFERDVPYTYEGSDNAEVFLVGTQRFADLSVVKPDFVVPNGFFFVRNGSIRLGVSEVRYQALPTDGTDALWTASTYGDSNDYIGTAVAQNRAGDSAVFALVKGVNTVVEYFNRELDDYFLTAYLSETNMLDAGAFRGWERTGYSLAAWISPLSEGASPPRNLAPVCRAYLGDTHFYSISASECADVAQHPGFYLETREAFFATLPDSTGGCPADQAPLYRLWNPRGSGHRFTTQNDVRHDMLSRGYIAEGYGPEGVAMCLGGNN
jgi:hypothetical protein